MTTRSFANSAGYEPLKFRPTIRLGGVIKSQTVESMNRLKAAKFFALASVFCIGSVVGFSGFYFFDMVRQARSYHHGNVPVAQLVPELQNVKFYTVASRSGRAELNATQWATVMRALGDATLEENPMKWQVAGTFSGDSDEGKFDIGLYQAGGQLVASFESPTRDRDYYRLYPNFDLLFDVMSEGFADAAEE
jgi:hypothetical protein